MLARFKFGSRLPDRYNISMYRTEGTPTHKTNFTWQRQIQMYKKITQALLWLYPVLFRLKKKRNRLDTDC